MKVLLSRIFIVAVLMCLAACQGPGIRHQDNAVEEVKQSPADVYVALGIEYMKRGMNDVALEKLKKGLQIDASSSDVHNVLGVLYDRLGKKELATQHYEKAVQLAPQNSSAQNNYARNLCSRGRYEQADEHFKKALANPLYKSPLLALTNAGVCAMKANELAKAETYFRTILQHNEKYAPALLQMAELNFIKKNYLSVRAYLQRYRAVKKHTAASLWLSIQAEKKLGNRDTVSSNIMLLKQLYPDSHEVGLLENTPN